MSNLYTVRCESPVDDQFRVRTLEAKSPKHAAALVDALELNRVAYSLTDRQPVRQIVERRHAEGVHATVNMDVFADSGLGGHDLLAYCEREHAVDVDGKVYGPHKQIRDHLQAHYQAEPYKVVSSELWLPSPEQLVRAALALRADEGAWKDVLDRLKEAGLPLAAVTGELYGLTAQGMIDGSAPIVYSTATMQCSLHTGYTQNVDTHHFFSDVSATEVTGTGYTTKGVTLASKTSTYDTASNQIRLDAADVSWASSTISATDAIVWDDTAGASTTDPVVGALDFGATVATTNGTFQITWDATGIIVYTI